MRSSFTLIDAGCRHLETTAMISARHLETTAMVGAAPQVSVRRRMKALGSDSKWSLDGLTLVLILVGLVAAIGIGAMVMGRRTRMKKEAERKAREAARPSKRKPATGAIRFEYKEGERKPAFVEAEQTLEQLKVGSKVLLLADSLGAGIIEAEVGHKDGDTVCFVSDSTTEQLSRRIFVARQRFNAEVVVFTFLLDNPSGDSIKGTLEAVLDKHSPVIRLQSAGTIPADLLGILLMAPKGGARKPDSASMPSRQVSLTAIGISRAWVANIDDIDKGQSLVLRCVIPGESDSLEFTARRRGERTDDKQRHVVELVLESADTIATGSLIRYVALHAHATVAADSGKSFSLSSAPSMLDDEDFQL